MPYERPGQGYYATATKALTHGDPCTEDGVVGVAIKQKAPAWDAGLADQDAIAIGEAFHIRTKGIHQVAFVTGAAKGDPIYIVAADNTLTETASGNIKFGRVVEIEGQRGTPTGFMRVDLDLKDGF
jgi:hypothetical protein